MATNKLLAPNIDASDLVNYPNGRIKDNSGAGDGTAVNRQLYSDLHEFFAKLMRMAAITYNALPDNEGNGFQLVQALQALAGKNDMLQTLNSDGTTVSIATKLGILQLGELMICQSAFNYAAEASIEGNDTSVITRTLTVSSPFKTNDYILLQVTSGGISLIRLATADNLDVLAAALNYLKACSDAEATTGTITSKAVTPHALKAAFTEWVTDPTAAIPFIATDATPGLLSASDKTLLDTLSNPVKNRGWVSGIDVCGNTVGSSLAVGGDIASATALGQDVAVPRAQEYQINFAHNMANTNYMVQLFIESQTPTANSDASVFTPVFRNKLVGSCTFILREGMTVTQSLKVHVKVEQLS
jgi:hypothetical protein